MQQIKNKKQLFRTRPFLNDEDLAYHPLSSPNTFQYLFLSNINEAAHDFSIVKTILDPTVTMVSFPSFDQNNPEEYEEFYPQLNECIKKLDDSSRQLACISWKKVNRDTLNIAIDTSWADNYFHLLDGQMQILFFIDTQAIISSLIENIESLGYICQYQASNEELIISDRRFEMKIDLHNFCQQSIVSGAGPLEMIAQSTEYIRKRFSIFSSLENSLWHKFSEHSFIVKRDGIKVFKDNILQGSINYIKLIEYSLKSKLHVSLLLQGLELEDLMLIDQPLSLQMRSLQYYKSFSNKLQTVKENYTQVYSVQHKDGHNIALTSSDLHPSRISFYNSRIITDEQFTHFKAHVYFIEENNDFTLLYVGDRCASIALSENWTKAAVEEWTDCPDEVHLKIYSEDCLLIHSIGASTESIKHTNKLKDWLLEDLYPQGVDKIDHSFSMNLSIAKARALFEIIEINEQYSALREASTQKDLLKKERQNFLRALSFQLLGIKKYACEYFEKAARQDRLTGSVHLAYGQFLMQEGENERALSFLEFAVEKNPKDPSAQNALGLVRYFMGLDHEATFSFEHAVRLAPQETRYLVNLGRSYTELSQYIKAQACLERALDFEPQSAEANTTMAILCSKLGDIKGAKKHAEEALKIFPSNLVIQELVAVLKLESMQKR